jgi:ribosomal protein S18 acetylase RimI-like enzyme
MMIDAEISKYKEQDFQPLAAFFREIYAATYPFLDEKFLRPSRFETILRKHTLPKMDVWLAKINGELIGFAAVGKNFIDQLYIHTDYQGKGLGSFWIEQAKAKYPDFLELYTLGSNKKAIAFYEKHGFKIIEKGIAPDENVPDVKMLWRGRF